MSTSARETTRQNAARDILLQVVARVFNLGLGVFVTALVVRTLGQAGYGQWSTILIVLTLIGYFANFGTEAVTTREAARDPEREHEWIGAMMLLRLLLVIPLIALAIGAMFVMQRSEQMLIAGLILVATMPFGGFGALQLIFQLRVKNLVPMLVLTLRSVLWGIAVLIIYLDGYGMVALAIGLTVTTAIGTIVQSVLALKLAERRPRPSREKAGALLRTALPIGVSGMLIIAYARIDQILVFAINGSKAAGLYGSVYYVLDQSHFVPISILTTLAPVMAAAWPVDRARLLRTARLTAELMAVASFGALAFAIVAAEPLVTFIFGKGFAGAAPVLPVLGAAFVFISFGYLNGNLMVVLGLQRRLLRISLLALVVNIAGNLILLPLVGFMGAAWMTLATEMVVFSATLRLIVAELGTGIPHPGRIGTTALAAVVLGGVLEGMVLAGAPLAALIAAACVLYPALLLALGALALDDLRMVLRRRLRPGSAP
jgi:O-antigen/teichoic acid export membrane protein